MSAPTRTALGEPAQAPTPVSGAGTTISELAGTGDARTGALGSSSITYAQYATFPLLVARSVEFDKKFRSNQAKNSTNSITTGTLRRQISLERISRRPLRRLRLKPLPSLRQRPPHRLAHLRILRVKLHQRGHDHRRGTDPREPFAIGRDDVPGRPGRAGVAEHLGEGVLVVVPVLPLRDVGGREFPVFLRH